MEKRNEGQGGTKSGAARPVWKTAAGGVQLAVWRNELPSGGAFQTATLERHFKRKDGQWDKSSSLRLNDIPKAILVLQKAYEYIALSGSQDEEGGDAPLSAPALPALPREIQALVAALQGHPSTLDALVHAEPSQGQVPSR